MKWAYWIQQYLEVHCTARGLASKTIRAYQDTLEGFQGYVRFRMEGRGPDELTARDLLEYVDYLRRERHNGASAVNRDDSEEPLPGHGGDGSLESSRQPDGQLSQDQGGPEKAAGVSG